MIVSRSMVKVLCVLTQQVLCSWTPTGNGKILLPSHFLENELHAERGTAILEAQLGSEKIQWKYLGKVWVVEKGPQSSDEKPRENLIPGALGSHKHPSFLLPPLNSNTTSLLQNLYFEAFTPVILSKRRNNMASCTSSFSHSSLFIENPSYSALDSWLTISIASKDCFNCHLLSNCQKETGFPQISSLTALFWG